MATFRATIGQHFMATLREGYGNILETNPLKALFYKGFRKLASPRGFEPLLPG